MTDPRQDGPGTRPEALGLGADSERRELTVLNCDLVDSTALASRFDAEDYASHYMQYLAVIRAAIERFSGIFGRDTGDGVEGYFGCIPSERPCSNASHCALDIIDAMSRSDIGCEMKVRIGIGTGLVMYEQGDSPKVFGVTAHRAARLQTSASPNTALCDERTYERSQADVEYSFEGERQLKGVPARTNVYRPIRSIPFGNRFLSRMRRDLSTLARVPMIGRNSELMLLSARWEMTQAGEGQVVVISGEAGIGKSRLIHEFIRSCQETDHHCFIFQASPHGLNSPLLPFLDFISRVAGFQQDDSDEEKKQKLANNLAGDGQDIELLVEVIADYFSIGAKAGGGLPGARRRSRIAQEALLQKLMDYASSKPVICVVEDAHWLDNTSRGLLDMLVRKIREHRVQALVTTRVRSPGTPGLDEFIEAWHATGISLGRLGYRDRVDLLTRLTRGTVQEVVVRELGERTTGNPLFLEELAKWYVESRGDGPHPQMRAGGADSPAIPDELTPLLMARLDAIGPAKELVKIAAVVEADLSPRLLSRLMDRPLGDVEQALEILVAEDLLVPRGADRFQFSHALLKAAAYDLLPKRIRGEVHARIAHLLVDEYPGIVATQPDLIAYHHSSAASYGQSDEHLVLAAGRWLDAARRSNRTGASEEAVPLVEGALQALERYGKDQDQLAFDLHLELGDAWRAMGHLYVNQSEGAYARAIELGERLYETAKSDDRLQVVMGQARALDAQFGAHLNAARLERAVESARALLALEAREDGSRARAAGLQDLGIVACIRGELPQARQYLSESIRIEAGYDPRARNCPSMAKAYLAVVSALMGNADEAVHLCDQAVAAARGEDIYDLTTTLGNCCYALYLVRQVDKMRANASELADISGRHGLFIWEQMAKFFSGWLDWRNGDATGLQDMVEAQAQWGDTEIESTFFLGVLAQACIEQGEHDMARVCLDKGLAHCASSGERFFLAGLLYLDAMLLHRDGPESPEAVGERLTLAMTVAKEQESTYWQERIRQGAVNMGLPVP